VGRRRPGRVALLIYLITPDQTPEQVSPSSAAAIGHAVIDDAASTPPATLG
jgi:hypothetical protein